MIVSNNIRQKDDIMGTTKNLITETDEKLTKSAYKNLNPLNRSIENCMQRMQFMEKKLDDLPNIKDTLKEKATAESLNILRESLK